MYYLFLFHIYRIFPTVIFIDVVFVFHRNYDQFRNKTKSAPGNTGVEKYYNMYIYIIYCRLKITHT